MSEEKKKDKGRDSPQNVKETHPFLRITEDCRQSKTMDFVLVRP